MQKGETMNIGLSEYKPLILDGDEIYVDEAEGKDDILKPYFFFIWQPVCENIGGEVSSHPMRIKLL